MWILIQTELSKLIRSKLYRICFGILTIIMLGLIVMEFQDVSEYNRNMAYQEEVMSWEERETNLIKYANESLAEDPWLTPLDRVQIERRIAIAEYRLENNIPRNIYKNVWWFFNDKNFHIIASFVIFLTVLLESKSIAGEYQGKTLKQLLLLPYKRWKILISKLVASLIVGFTLYGLMFLLGFVSGVILHGTNGITSQVVLYYGNQLSVMNMSLYSVLVVLLKIIDLLFYCVFTLLVAVLIKNTSGATLIAGLLALFAIPVGNFLAGYYKVINYLPFMNLDFRKFIDFGTTMPSIEAGIQSVVYANISVSKAILIVIITMAICIAWSINAFQKQEV